MSGDDIIQNVEKTNLFVVLFLVDYNVSIDEQIIEEEELPMFEFKDYICSFVTFLYLGFGFFLHAFVNTPSPTRTLPETFYRQGSKRENMYVAFGKVPFTWYLIDIYQQTTE